MIAVKRSVEFDNRAIAARMTNCQFAALRCRLDESDLCSELKALRCPKSRTLSRPDKDAVRTLLTSGWNTEYLLRLTLNAFDDAFLRHALQWAFPQAYYSTFATTCAFFRTAGFLDVHHAGVIKRFGALVEQGRYPERFRFLATGYYPVTFIGIKKSDTPSPLSFSEGDPASVETQICQFLKATREHNLQNRKKKGEFKTKNGKKKERLSREDWARLSDREGNTSLLSLLYRKRIKSNYRDIDVFLHDSIDAHALFRDLIHIVNCVNFAHEVFIARSLGLSFFRGAISDLPKAAAVVVNDRSVRLERIVGIV